MEQLTLEEAQQRIIADLTPLAGETVDLLEGRGRICARPVVAGRALPPFANSAMDGYAVRAADTREAPVELPVVGTVAAGAYPIEPCKPRTAWRIYTGAPLPDGADAVVMQEHVERVGSTVVLRQAATEGLNVRQAGEDMAPGEVVLQAGQGVHAGEISALAAQGRSWVQVVRRPRVAIVPTGDELVEIDQPLRPGHIPNSNSALLAAQVSEAGGIPIRCPVAPDEPQALAAQLLAAAQGADLLLTSGGVSVGDLDCVRQVLQEQGSMHFWKVAIKPGKPLAYGRLGRTPWVGLPGNPVSSFVCFELFARPALRRLAGHAQLTRPRRTARLRHDIGPRTRRELVRARLSVVDEVLWVVPLAKQGSGQQSSLCGVDALIDLPVSGEVTCEGAWVSLLVLNPEF